MINFRTPSELTLLARLGLLTLLALLWYAPSSWRLSCSWLFVDVSSHPLRPETPPLFNSPKKLLSSITPADGLENPLAAPDERTIDTG